MKQPTVMEVGIYAYDLIHTFNEWLAASSKKEYKFSNEEQYYLEQMIKIMNNQIDMLINYEIKRSDNEEVI